MNVSGEWSLDSGEMSGTVSEKTMSQSINLDGLEDGTHIITFKGRKRFKRRYIVGVYVYCRYTSSEIANKQSE